ncbi:cache domain-containing sensor histidine kinase [Paenibacillus cellulositrophicus]|uniref:cache domain-containing sensor histidine kinase n=1 Tax=Paenibacillus cellulositrophicus TaxID=562959 RepID=UPI003F81D702
MRKPRFFGKNLSLTYILILSFIFISTVPVVSTSIGTYFKSKDIINSNTSQYIIQMLKQTNGEIDLNLQQFNSDASFLINPVVQQLLNKQFHRDISYQERKALSKEVAQYNVVSPKMSDISVYSTKGIFLIGLSDNYTPLSGELISKVTKLDGQIYWNFAGYDTFHEAHIQGVRLIKNMLGPEIIPIGYLTFKMPENIIYDSIKELQLGQTGQAIIVDTTGTVLSGQNRNWVGRRLDGNILNKLYANSEGAFIDKIDGQTYFMAFHTSETTGWKTMGLVPIAEMTPGLQGVYKSNILYLGGWILISILLSLLITRTVVTPIKQLIRAMRSVESGDFSVQTHLTGNEEALILSSNFNKMTSRLKELISRVYEEELKEKSAQLRALQAQINPHFLYNTLDTIYWMLYMRGQEKIGDVVVAMSNMLRYSIGKNGPVVMLKDELDNLSNYIHIQSTRYQDRITFEYDIDHSLEDTRVLKLMLQPTIENAITHGLEPSVRPGIICTRIYRYERECRIEISDNGVGISAERLAQLMEPGHVRDGHGIQNVDERLRLTFGEAYGLTITSVEGKGTKVLYKLPLNDNNI